MAAAAKTATGALRRVLLPTIRRRLATSTGQPLISFTGARAGTTEAHQAEGCSASTAQKAKDAER
uniref:Uncharacterized protein n=1 Tax=Aegilops tauschii TaxID=37682 RepID=M8BKP2_AEGTA